MLRRKVYVSALNSESSLDLEEFWILRGSDVYVPKDEWKSVGKGAVWGVGQSTV